MTMSTARSATSVPGRPSKSDSTRSSSNGRTGRTLACECALPALGGGSPRISSQIDDEENQGIDAGFTYLGQFIDHDLTFDPMSSLQKHNDPDALTDFRTPRFDLDSLYGRGPDDQPYLFEDDGVHFKLGRPLTG